MEPKKLIEKFNKQAGKYAKKREKQAVNRWRRICSQARGETLEAAIGAGMNFPHYPKSIRLTGVDFSPAMLEEAKKAANAYGIATDFILSAVEELDFPANSFDTIVSTGSLCTYEDPKSVLNMFNRWCKPDGQILLLEHGLSTLPPLARLQKGLDSFAVKAIGCHQNRDIEKIVRNSDIQVKHIERAVFGYLYIIHAKPHRT